MGTATIQVPESQMIEWITALSSEGEREVLRRLILRLDEIDARIERGAQRMREISAERGLPPWDSMSEEEQATLIDQILHEP